MLRLAWKRHARVLLTLALILSLTRLLPALFWLVSSCGQAPYDPIIGAHAKFKVVDPFLRGVLKMFPLYNHSYLSKENAGWKFNGVTGNYSPRINIVGSSDFHTEDTSVSDCVPFLGPQEMKEPRICVYPRDTDRMISAVLRDFGTWEMDRLIDMEWAMQTFTDMQLVDLGCNIGVFALYAAGMGRHVLAVDVLPSNLKLLHSSLSLNNRRNSNYVILRRNSTFVYPARNKVGSNDGYVTAQRDETMKPRLDNRDRKMSDSLKLRRHEKQTLTKLTGETPPINGEAYKNKFRIRKRNKYISRKHTKQLRKLLEVQHVSKQIITKISESLAERNISDPRRRKNVALTTPDLSTSARDHSAKMAANWQTVTETVKLSQLVTLVQNAVYSDRNSRLSVHLRPNGNIGGAEVVPPNSPVLDQQPGDLMMIDAVCLDDLLPLVKAPSVYLKMDMEGSEAHALRCAQAFFEKVRVRFVLMEWLFQTRSAAISSTSAREVIRFFTAKGFIPTTGAGLDVKGGAGENRGVSVLDVNAWRRWPDMVLWMDR